MQSIRDQLLSYATQQRDLIIAGANNGDDDDIPAEERPNRELVAPGCRIKPFDEVEIYGLSMLYLCPGRGANMLIALSIDGAIIQQGSYDVSAVTDRIPYDPEEEPLPIFEGT